MSPDICENFLDLEDDIDLNEVALRTLRMTDSIDDFKRRACSVGKQQAMIARPDSSMPQYRPLVMTTAILSAGILYKKDGHLQSLSSFVPAATFIPLA